MPERLNGPAMRSLLQSLTTEWSAFPDGLSTAANKCLTLLISSALAEVKGTTRHAGAGNAGSLSMEFVASGPFTLNDFMVNSSSPELLASRPEWFDDQGHTKYAISFIYDLKQVRLTADGDAIKKDILAGTTASLRFDRKKAARADFVDLSGQSTESKSLRDAAIAKIAADIGLKPNDWKLYYFLVANRDLTEIAAVTKAKQAGIKASKGSIGRLRAAYPNEIGSLNSAQVKRPRKDAAIARGKQSAGEGFRVNKIELEPESEEELRREIEQYNRQSPRESKITKTAIQE